MSWTTEEAQQVAERLRSRFDALIVVGHTSKGCPTLTWRINLGPTARGQALLATWTHEGQEGYEFRIATLHMHSSLIINISDIRELPQEVQRVTDLYLHDIGQLFSYQQRLAVGIAEELG